MTMNVLTASVSGEDISDPASDRNIAKILGLKPRRQKSHALKLHNEKHALMQFPKMSKELSLISGVRPLFLELLQIKKTSRE
jgi:hypothetical protein